MQEGHLDVGFTLIVSTLLLLVLSGLIVTMFYMFQNRALYDDRTIFNLKHDHEKNLMEATLEMQEMTFEHISLEIHDNVMHSISLANYQLADLQGSEDERVVAASKSVISILNDTMNDLSGISKGLNRDLIQSQGFLKAVNVEIERLKDLKLFTVDLKITGEPIFMSDGKEVVLFRIIQEAFHNVIKHSHASAAVLAINYDVEEISIEINDNGVGFPADKELVKKDRSAGLINMRKRVSLLNGQMSRGNTTTGAFISIKIPCNNDK